MGIRARSGCMSPQHLFEVSDGPSLRHLEASSVHREDFKLLEFTVTNTATGQKELVHGYVDGLVETAPAGRRARWFIRVVVQPDVRRHYYYDSYHQTGFELPLDHPFCQLEQFLYR